MPRRTFEALFRPEVVTLGPEVRAELVALGVDPEQLQAGYPVGTLRQAMEVVVRHVCPELPAEDGMRELGRRFVVGFKQTPIGWIFARMAPFFGPERTLQDLPRYLSSVRTDFPVAVLTEGDRRYRFICLDEVTVPGFIAGCIEGVLLTCGVERSQVRVVSQPQGFELEISW